MRERRIRQAGQALRAALVIVEMLINEMFWLQLGEREIWVYLFYLPVGCIAIPIKIAITRIIAIAIIIIIKCFSVGPISTLLIQKAFFKLPLKVKGMIAIMIFSQWSRRVWRQWWFFLYMMMIGEDEDEDEPGDDINQERGKRDI